MNPLIQKIVVPIDFSDASVRAAQYAAALARRLDASVHLVHVLEPSEMASGTFEFYGGLPPSFSIVCTGTSGHSSWPSARAWRTASS